MLSYIVFIPAIFATFYILFLVQNRSHAPTGKAFLNFYLPTLLLLPQEFEADLPLFPNPTFAHAILIPILIAYFILPSKKEFSIPKGMGFVDMLIVAYMFVNVLTDYLNPGGKPQVGVIEEEVWKTTLFRDIFNILIPYYLVKKIIYPQNLTEAFAKRVIILTLISLVLTAYEWRFIVNMHLDLLRPFFGYPNIPWTPSYRFGLLRITGPYVHPILFGIIIAVGLIFNHWLTKNGGWKGSFNFLPLSSYLKGFIIGILLFVGLLLTFSRGPLFSTVIAILILGLGYTRHKYLGLAGRMVLFFIIGIFAVQIYGYYAEMDLELAPGTFDQTAAYRAQLLIKYMKFVNERPWIGWGSYSWPQEGGMESIDNHYLLVLIKHGYIAFALQVFIFLIVSYKLLRLGLKIPYKERKDQSLAFTLIGIIFMLSVALATVYMGGQVEQMTFMIIGLSQGFIEGYRAKQRILKQYIPISMTEN